MFLFKKKYNLLTLDIGDGSIEAISLEESSRVNFYTRVELQEGAVIKGLITNEQVLVSSLKLISDAYKKQMGASKDLIPATLSISESKVFIHCFDIDINDKDKIDSDIRLEVSKFIPWEDSEVYSDYILKKNKTKYHVVYASVHKHVVDSYKKAFLSAGLELEIVSIESIALGRSLLSGIQGDGAKIILDIGSSTTNINIFGTDNVLALSISVPIAGQLFSSMLAKDKGITVPEAESQKRQGQNFFDQAHISEYPNFINSCEALSREIKRTIGYFEEKTKVVVNNIILAGGSSLLNGFDGYLNIALGKKVIAGDPLKNISNKDIFKSATPGILFADVIGQAMIANDKKAQKINFLKIR